MTEQEAELTEFYQKVIYYPNLRIKLDLDGGINVSYGKFGDLIVQVKAIHSEITRR